MIKFRIRQIVKDTQDDQCCHCEKLLINCPLEYPSVQPKVATRENLA